MFVTPKILASGVLWCEQVQLCATVQSVVHCIYEGITLSPFSFSLSYLVYNIIIVFK